MFSVNADGKTIEELLKERVETSADFMAPYFLFYFGYQNSYFVMRSLDIRIGSPRYSPRERGDEKDVMTLPADADDSDIGHEIGHWFHYMINPEVFYDCLRGGLRWSELAHEYLETIADYGEAVNVTAGSVVNDEGLKPHLRFLVRELLRCHHFRLYETLEINKERLSQIHSLLRKYLPERN